MKGTHGSSQLRRRAVDGPLRTERRSQRGRECHSLRRTFPGARTLDQLAAIVESSDDAIVGKALDGTILSWNRAAERMYGFSAEEVLGQRISMIVPPEHARELESILRAVGRGERVDHLETVRKRKGGSCFDVSVTVSPIRDEAGEIVGASAIARDISERKRDEAAMLAKERELEQTCAFLERAEALSRTGTWILGLGDPPTLVWSKECFRLLGMDEKTPLSVELFLSLVHPDDRERLSSVMATAIANHQSYEVEHRLVAADGSLRRLHLWAEPEYDDDGVAVRVLGVAQDITDRYEADAAMRSSERRFRLLAENARDFIFRYELLPEPGFDYASPASLEVTGYSPEELYEDPGLIDQLVDPERTAEISELLMDSGITGPMDVEVHRRDGTVSWVSQQLTFVRDADGQLIAVEGISRDITRRKRAEEQLAHQGLHDALTSLPNRVLLRDRLALALTRSELERGSVAVVALDLDDFKLINDAHGQEAGDTVLVTIAARLQGAVAQQDTLARTGSDEFIAVAQSTRRRRRTRAGRACARRAARTRPDRGRRAVRARQHRRGHRVPVRQRRLTAARRRPCALTGQAAARARLPSSSSTLKCPHARTYGSRSSAICTVRWSATSSNFSTSPS